MCAVQVPWWREQSYYDVPGRGSYARDGGGVLISQAIHVMDLMLSLTGPAASSVQAMCATTPLHTLEAEDFAAACVRFASGAVGSIVATTAAYPGGAETLSIDGTQGQCHAGSGPTCRCITGMAAVEELGGGDRHGRRGGPHGLPLRLASRSDRGLRIDSIRCRMRSRGSAAVKGLRVHQLIDALVTSSCQGKQVDVVL